MPYVTVVAGTTITASWGNANVRDQVVTPFANAAARTSAITVPVTGMVSYLADVDRVETYDGTAWVPVQQTYVARAVSTATVIATTAEVTAISATFIAKATRRYKVSLVGAVKSSVAGDVIQLRARSKAGASVDSSGTLIGTVAYVCVTVTAPGIPAPLIDFATGIAAGQVTVGVTLQRFSGTGNTELNHSAGVHENVLLIEDVGSSL